MYVTTVSTWSSSVIRAPSVVWMIGVAEATFANSTVSPGWGRSGRLAVTLASRQWRPPPAAKKFSSWLCHWRTPKNYLCGHRCVKNRLKMLIYSA
ncbi:hypothetical protein [Azorhizophilus paspali]|uniref:hypothetical protein n=1 Tax=Azorhizophilus paspali TaxID=69963 RepID=UPI003D4B0495